MTDQTSRRICVVTDDAELQKAAARGFPSDGPLTVCLVRAGSGNAESAVRDIAPSALVVDLGSAADGSLDGLRRLIRAAGAAPTIVVADELSPEAARTCLRLKISDLLLKPVGDSDLVRAIFRILGEEEEGDTPSSQIFTFLPAMGGTGNTTLAIQTAFILHEMHGKGGGKGKRGGTCLVDLNLQHGACAEYLDLESRFDITEIENNPDRLDRQLLEAMLSRHASGLAVISAPPCPWEMRSFRAGLVIRLLDLVSTHFDTVVIDLPRTWFPWTDSILGGSDKIFVVTEATVPALRHTQRLTNAIQERIGRQAPVGVVVNRYDARGAGATVRESDIRDVLGETYVGRVANNYKVVRQALDRGVPVREVMAACDVLTDIRRIVAPDAASVPEPRSFARTALRLFGGGRLKMAG